MKKFFNYKGLALEVTLKDGKVVSADIDLDINLKSSSTYENISYEDMLGYNIDYSIFSPFEKDVLKKVREIPEGRVMTYRDLAEAVGNEKAFRAVGNTLAKNPFPIFIPCHRVIKSDLTFGNYSKGGPVIKRILLKGEGIKFRGNRVERNFLKRVL
ncbi:MAG: MGMT family protein [Candidatus Hydrothermarchaeales archaeon]